MANVGTFNVATYLAGASSNRIVITESCAGIDLFHTFKGPNILAGEMDSDVAGNLVAAFGSAFTGKVTISYVTPAGTHVLAQSVPYGHLVQFCAGITGKKIVINPVSWNTVDNHSYTAHAYIPFSHSGAIKLGDGSHIIVEFEGFTDVSTGNTQAENYTGIINAYGRVLPTWANDILRFDTKVVVGAGSAQSFECSSYGAMLVPYDMTKLQLTGSNGLIAELDSTSKVTYVSTQLPPTFSSLGVNVVSINSFVRDLRGYVRGNITLNGSAQFYFVTSLPLSQ